MDSPENISAKLNKVGVINLIKIYNCFDLQLGYLIPSDIEKNNFLIVEKIEEADLVFAILDANLQVLLDNLKTYKYNGKPLVLLNLYHIEEGPWIKNFYNDFLINFKSQAQVDKVVLIHHNSIVNNNDLIYYDIIWNRQKLYMTDYDSVPNLEHKIWSGHSKQIYALTEIPEKKQLGKYNKILKYVCANRIYRHNGVDWRGIKVYEPRCRYRHILKNFLVKGTEDSYINEGYLGDVINDVELETEDPMFSFMGVGSSNGGGSWMPIANHIYNSSYWSTYIETITYGESHVGSVTEKTYDPLIKGHFILPFGYSGLIEDIKNYGFVLPNWIDYSYDSIKNDDLRFIEFLRSLHSLLKISIKSLASLYKQDFDIIKHNRNIFFLKDYDFLAPKLVKWIDTFQD